MNWKTLILTAGALLILPTSINAAEAYQTNREQENSMEHTIANRGGSGRGMERILQQLDLTDEQSQQIETLKERSQTERSGLKEQLQTQRQEVQALLASDATTEEIRSRHQEAQNLHQQLNSNRFETMLEIREILTTEQRAQMTELMDARGGRRFGGQR